MSSGDKGKGPATSMDIGDDDNSRTLPALPPIDRGLPWVEKYRPKDLNQLVSHTDIIRTLERLIDQDKMPHLLFHGPPGSGKTSTIMAIANRLYGKSYSNMVLELNASDDRGIAVVRNQIKTFASTRKLFSSGTKLIILDEVDAMTNDAQSALRRVIEKYTTNTRFCLICNYVGKIIPALQSRCTRFRFAPLGDEQVRGRLEHVIESEGVKVTEDGIKALLHLGKGDMRKSINILQSASMAFDKVDESACYLCTGNPLPADIANVLNWVFNDSFKEAYEKILDMQMTRGIALSDIVTEIHAFLMHMELPTEAFVHLCKELADVEFRLSHGTTPSLQLSGFVGAFQQARKLIADSAVMSNA